MSDKPKRRVAITGLGVVTSLGEGVPKFWDSLITGKSGVTPIQMFDASGYPSRIASQVLDFDPANYVDKREAKRIDRFALFALNSAISAVENSSLDMNRINRDRCGVIVGSGIGGLGEIEREHKTLLDRGPDRVSPFCVPKLMVNAANANISIYYGLRGPNAAVVTACASAAHAIGDAMHQIRMGNADIRIQVIRQFDAQIDLVKMDAEKIKQVILNLLSNAIEFTPQRGRIEIITKNSSNNKSPKYVQIQIKDNGTGIPESNIDNVFDPYFTTKHKSNMHSGTGLGLFIAHQNIQDHRGTIEVKSKPNQGAKFILTLPLNPTDSSQ